MIRVPLSRLQPGMILARPVPAVDDSYQCLIERGREIPMDLVPRLKRMGIRDVWVRHRDFEFLEDLVDRCLGEHQDEIHRQVRQNFEAVMCNSSVELDLCEFEESIGRMFDFLKTDSTARSLLQELGAFDEYLMSHSTNIAYLAMLVGRSLARCSNGEQAYESECDPTDLDRLALGCLLHDVGKMRISPKILHKQGKLTDEEMAEMRRHPIYGYEMVRGRLPECVAQIVLNHHQRYDGSGYPALPEPITGRHVAPLRGRQIPLFARIAIIADVYDAATSWRCYSEAKLPVEVLHEMRVKCKGFFDPLVEAAFYRIVPPFPIGQVVVLNNGVEAVVVDFNPDAPTQPTVQCVRTPDGQPLDNPGTEEIDLSLYPDWWIAEVEGRDVQPLLETPDPTEPEPLLA